MIRRGWVGEGVQAVSSNPMAPPPGHRAMAKANGMYANEFLLWLQGFRAAGGDPRSPEGRAMIERILSGDEPDPICPDCEHHVRERWLEQYLSYYEADAASV